MQFSKNIFERFDEVVQISWSEDLVQNIRRNSDTAGTDSGDLLGESDEDCYKPAALYTLILCQTSRVAESGRAIISIYRQANLKSVRLAKRAPVCGYLCAID